jgi:hypothetical protein
MRALGFVRALFAAVFSRTIIILIYWTLTILACIDTMLNHHLLLVSRRWWRVPCAIAVLPVLWVL